MHYLFLINVIVLLLFSNVSAEELNWHASGKTGVVVAGRTGSAEAGFEILNKGGNAADAAAATLLALSVTDSDQFNIGSEVPILVYDAKRGVVEAISGMGTAPALATREYFEKAGGIESGNITAMSIPAPMDAILTMLGRYGTMTFAEVAAPALRILDNHEKEWYAKYARTIRRLIEAEKGAKDRKRGLRLAADYFYRGPIAREIDKWSRENGGLIRYSDLATYTTRIEEPVKVDYNGYTIYKCNTWTQGPYLLQALKLLEGFDLESMGFQTPETIHLIIEAKKLALADRDVYYGDPLFSDVPMNELLSEEYAIIRRKLIDMQNASMVQRPGDPLAGKALLDEKRTHQGLKTLSHDTTTCLTADRWGNVIAATPSGWNKMAGDTGVWMSSRMVSFNTWEGHPNCIEPGKRPRITLTPSLVLKDGKPVMAISVAGGDTQDQGTLQIITNYVNFGLEAKDLVSTPRYISRHFVGSFGQPPPELGELTFSTRADPELLKQLRKRGHIIESEDFWQCRTVIVIDAETGLMHGAGDPTAPVPRHAASY